MKSSERAHNTSIDIIRNLFPDAAEDDVKQKAQKLLKVADSIGADYSENTLTEIATSYYKITK